MPKKEHRHPKDVKIAQSFEADSARRDLSINAIGITKDGEIIDYQGGVNDIKNKIIRAVGDPKQRLIEDALRSLRILRFAAKLGFTIEPKTLSAVKELNGLISKVSAERITDELYKIAGAGGNALANFIEHMDETGMLERILPEVKAMQGVNQPLEHHPEGDCWYHTLHALRASKLKDPVANLAVLFHDLGKPNTLQYKDGKETFYGHHHEGSKIFDAIADRLKISNKDREAIKFVIDNHMIGFQVNDGMKKQTMFNLRSNPYWEYLKNNLYADIMSRGLDREDEFNAIVDKLDTVYKDFGAKQEYKNKMKALIDGRKIMDLIPGIKGIDIGRVKKQTEEWITDNNFNVSPEEVEQYVKKVGMML